MGADSSFEVWIVVAILAVFAGMFLTYALVELPGRFLVRLLSGYEPGRTTSRAVGWGAWTVVVIIIYAMTN